MRRTVRVLHQITMTLFPPEVSTFNRALSSHSRAGQDPSAGALRAEDLLPSLEYRELVRKLGPLTDLGVFEDGGLATALAVARLVDRGRISRSGWSAQDLTEALAKYRLATARPVQAIERALEQAIALVRSSEVTEAAAV